MAKENSSMILCTDVAYGPANAVAAGVLFEKWESESPLATHLCYVDQVLPYRSGHFFERELPCLVELIQGISSKISLVVVDGFVWLGTDKPGLGQHLHLALEQKIPIVGVAKNSFANNDLALPVYRGGSNRALWVTSVGIKGPEAAKALESMHGDYRFPTMLKLADTLCREGL